MSGIQQMLLGGGSPSLIPLIPATCLGNNATIVGGGSSTAEYALRLSGGLARTAERSISAGPFTTGWEFVQYWIINLQDYSQLAQYEVRGTWTPIISTGTTTGVEVWTVMNLSGVTERIWTLNTVYDDAKYELLVEIRATGTTDVLTSATITFETFGSP